MLYRSRVGLGGAAIALFVLGPVGWAAANERLVIEPFPRSSIVQQVVEESVDHGVVIGSIRRINNQLRAEREVRTTGELIRVTLEIPAGHDRTEAFLHAKRQVLAQPHRMLYFCEGRECGSSSLWANQVLGFARLYGPEDNQAYVSMRLDDEPQRFISLYAITRGNRQVFLHIDQFTPDQPVTEDLYPTPATLIKVLRADGSIDLPNADMTDPDSEATRTWLDLLNRALRTDMRMRVAVHGVQAPAFVQALVDRGIRDQRLEVGEPSPEVGIRISTL
ncbi:DUF4892 domain-containing protein [Halopseudomonas phragmitis]|uniref:DUF4892 domain-containing protein n=1 Tax=Halopseudomonas phragmitis TaxID=1931241 RepID=A0A1V0B7U0_9GAMM|nr:DUF4892 domain-containing protein [Halopseudomonas phragmitis]AQZ95951.1 hypothetical protein BVH74_14850 [Halopseudomonas phragmitis]